MSNKRPLILFSGGLDSTYLLQEELTKGDVDVLYVVGRQCPIKVKSELKVRDRIIKALEDFTGNRVDRRYKVDLNFGITDANDRMYQADNWKFQQPHHWLMGALQTVNEAHHSKLLIAYVTGDQIMPDIPHIKAAWDSLMAFTKVGFVPIEFPLIYRRKHDILNDICAKAYFLHWVCEIPRYNFISTDKDATKKFQKSRYRACGKCDACITKAATIYSWCLKKDESEEQFKDMMFRRFKYEIRGKLAKKKSEKQERELALQNEERKNDEIIGEESRTECGSAVN